MSIFVHYVHATAVLSTLIRTYKEMMVMVVDVTASGFASFGQQSPCRNSGNDVFKEEHELGPRLAPGYIAELSPVLPFHNVKDRGSRIRFASLYLLVGFAALHVPAEAPGCVRIHISLRGSKQAVLLHPRQHQARASLTSRGPVACVFCRRQSVSCFLGSPHTANLQDHSRTMPGAPS